MPVVAGTRVGFAVNWRLLLPPKPVTFKVLPTPGAANEAKVSAFVPVPLRLMTEPPVLRVRITGGFRVVLPIRLSVPPERVTALPAQAVVGVGA